MKKLINTLAIVLVLGACKTTELDQPVIGPGTDDNPQAQIPSGDFVANDSLETIEMIAGTSERLWTAVDFTLAGSSSLTDCRLDDQMTFNTNGTYEYNAGRTFCGAEDNRRVRVGTWTVLFENKQMIFDAGTNNEYTAQIIALDSNELSLRGSYLNLEVRGKYRFN